MPNPKYNLSDVMRHIRELMRCIVVLEDRIKELERQNAEYEWTNDAED